MQSRFSLAGVICCFLLATSLDQVKAADKVACAMPPTDGNTWLPTAPEPNETTVPPGRPNSDCFFYKPAWQRFLVATGPTGGPTFLGYPSLSDLFSPLSPLPSQHGLLMLTARTTQVPNDPKPNEPRFTDTAQAGLGGTLIDQHGRFVFYAIHVNPAFQSFLQKNGLTKLPALKNLTPTIQSLSLPVGLMELKSAWMIVENQQSAPTYFVVPATVPHYIIKNGQLAQATDDKGKPIFDSVSAALLALHVVFTLPGHPEMIWSTFEHVHLDDQGRVTRDNAPAAPSNPPIPQDVPLDSLLKWPYPLYKAGTTPAAANKPVDAVTMAQHWDGTTQTFSIGGLLQTSVYRPYPGSKTDPDPDEDDEVALINDNVTAMFRDAVAKGLINSADKRQYYRLVGAVWLNDPKTSFLLNKVFVNPLDHTTDEPTSEMAGEGRLGSTAMESFTEYEDNIPGGSPNCFSCHNTRAVRRTDQTLLMKPALMNVSHVMSRFVDLMTPQSKK